MDDKWKIELYKTSSNKSPIDDFVDNLNPKVQNKIIETFGFLREFGINLGMPHSKKVVGTSLWELRILGGDNVRIFYIAKKGKTFLLLHGFQKKKQKTDKKEIRVALDRFSDYGSRTQN